MSDLAQLPLLDLIPALSPELKPPFHLREWCDLIEKAATNPIRALCSCPIRHFKTTTTLHGIIWLLLRDPSRRVILLTHSHQRAQTLGKQLRQLAKETPVGPTRGWDTIDEWRNDRGGGAVIMSADQSKLGYDCGALFFDDPIDEMGWDDPRQREAVDKTISHYTARCMSKGVPGPVLGVASRGHPDDPIGRRLSRTAVEWVYVHYPAIIGTGHERRAFAPEVGDLPALDAMRRELKEADPAERIWHAQLMGDPQPEGSDLFGAPTFYVDLPTWGGWRTAHGADFAYVDARGSDFCAIVTARAYGRKLYLVAVQRHRLDATLLESTCKTTIATHGRAPFWSYQSGPEVGLSKLLIQRGIPIGIMPARYNKLVRAQKTVRRWNDGEILVPHESSPHWKPNLPGFLHRVALFRGHEKDRDDEVDALVSLADATLGSATIGSVGAVGARRPYAGLLG